MKQWLVLFSIVAVMVIAQETFTAVDYQGTQIIDTKFSYMFNLRYANGSSTLYFRADKSHPNVFSATFQGNEPKNFKISTKSPFPNAPAFFAFDAITNKGVDYIVGSTFPRQGSKPVLPIVVANTKDKVSDVTGGTYENYYLYTPVIDSSSLNINTDKVNVYFAGWGMGDDAKGLIISKVEATLNVDNPQAQILSQQTLVINEHCYDVWNDINKPHLFIDNINGKKYLILVVTGRCDGIWKIEINDEFMKSSSIHFTYDHPGDTNSEIFSSAYDFKNHVAFFTLKKYNSDDLSLHLISMTPTDAIAPSPVVKVLGKNDSNPLLAFDRHNDNLMFLSSDNDHIYKIAGKDITGKTTPYQIATLPPKLKQVSSARVFGDFLYMVTYEPDAQFARISMTAHFCQQFCGAYGFCAQPPKLCRCAEGYVYNLSATATDNQVCVPKHEEEVVKKTIEEKGAAIALGVLFFIALIGAAAGWVMWWRSRQSQYMNVSN